MYNEVPYEDEFAGTTAWEFANMLQEAIIHLPGIDDSDLELYKLDDSTHYKVAYFGIDDRDFSRIEHDAVETIFSKLLTKHSMSNMNWSRNDAYPDGTASYILYFDYN